MAEDMVIFARVFDLLEWLVPKGESFPRPFRHTVTERLLGAALDLPEQLFAAQCRRGQATAGSAGGSGCRPQQAAALSAARPSLALAVRRSVRARQPHGGRGRAAARWLDPPGGSSAGMRRRGALRPGGASLRYAPDAASGVRTGPARAIHLPSAASRKPWSAGPVGIRRVDDGCGTRTPHESRCCRCGCSGGCCCGCPRARCPGCCSRSRRAPRETRNRAAPPVFRPVQVNRRCGL